MYLPAITGAMPRLVAERGMAVGQPRCWSRVALYLHATFFKSD